MDKKIIRKVWINKSNGQKLITIPSTEKIQNGDYVIIQRVIIK